MHSTDRSSREAADGCDMELAEPCRHTKRVKREKKDNNGQKEGYGCEARIVKDLALGVPVLQDDSSITDEMHSPDADTTHGNRRGHEQKPVRWLVAGYAGESQVDLPVVCASS